MFGGDIFIPQDPLRKSGPPFNVVFKCYHHVRITYTRSWFGDSAAKNPRLFLYILHTCLCVHTVKPRLTPHVCTCREGATCVMLSKRSTRITQCIVTYLLSWRCHDMRRCSITAVPRYATLFHHGSATICHMFHHGSATIISHTLLNASVNTI